MDPSSWRVLASRRFDETLWYRPPSRILVSPVDTILTTVAYDVWKTHSPTAICALRDSPFTPHVSRRRLVGQTNHAQDNGGVAMESAYARMISRGPRRPAFLDRSALCGHRGMRCRGAPDRSFRAMPFGRLPDRTRAHHANYRRRRTRYSAPGSHLGPRDRGGDVRSRKHGHEANRGSSVRTAASSGVTRAGGPGAGGVPDNGHSDPRDRAIRCSQRIWDRDASRCSVPTARWLGQS